MYVFLAPIQHITMISEGSCDTEDLLEIQLFITGINYIMKYIKIKYSYFK